MLLTNARLIGRDGLFTIELQDGLIRSVSTGSPAGATNGIDLDGRWVLPGLWDHHVHFSQWSISRDRLDLSAASSAAHAAALVGEHLDTRSDRPELIVGVGYRDALWPEELTTAALDQRSGHTAVVLISGDLHAVWLNSAALTRFDLAPTVSGQLREDPAFAVQLAVADLSVERVDQLAAAAANAAAARGVVGIVDFELPDIAATWQRRIAGGLRSLRVICSVWPSALPAAITRGARSGDPLPGTAGLATVGPLKVIIDGSLNTRTAYCFERYPGLPDTHDPYGQLTVSAAELIDLLRTAQANGLPAAVHAIGDHANAIALEAFATVGSGGSIEHAQLLTPADITRLAELGLTASVQPEHLVDDRDVADHYWAGRTERAFAFGSLLAAGARLTLGSDAPVAPLDPWRAIAAAVARTGDARPSWHPEQSLTVTQALSAATGTGSIDVMVGDPADLVIVEADPLTRPSQQLREMPVAATLLGGRFTHRRF